MKQIQVKINGEWVELLRFENNKDSDFEDIRLLNESEELKCSKCDYLLKQQTLKCIACTIEEFDEYSKKNEWRCIKKCEVCGALPTEHHKYQDCLIKNESECEHDYTDEGWCKREVRCCKCGELKPKIEKLDVFSYVGYLEQPKETEHKNELWVQLKLLQDKINELIDQSNNN